MEDQRASLGAEGHRSLHCHWLEGFRHSRSYSLHAREPRAAIPAATTKVASGTLADRVDQLGQRATRLNDQAAVTNVLDTYGYAIDRKLWNQAANLFADNGTLSNLEKRFFGTLDDKAGFPDLFNLADDAAVRDNLIVNAQLSDHVHKLLFLFLLLLLNGQRGLC